MVGQRPGRGLLAVTEVREEGGLNQGALQEDLLGLESQLEALVMLG